MRVQDLSLDEYMFFHDNPIHRDLSNRHLNQIISMHGFKKMHRKPKKNILDALSSIDLLLPFRSTLMQNISSSASLTNEEVSTDLATLAWQECALQSIETLNSTKQNIEMEQQASGFKLLRPTPEYGFCFSGEKRKRNAVGAPYSVTAQLPCWLSL